MFPSCKSSMCQLLTEVPGSPGSSWHLLFVKQLPAGDNMLSALGTTPASISLPSCPSPGTSKAQLLRSLFPKISQCGLHTGTQCTGLVPKNISKIRKQEQQ